MPVFTERDRRTLKLSTSHPGKFLKIRYLHTKILIAELKHLQRSWMTPDKQYSLLEQNFEFSHSLGQLQTFVILFREIKTATNE